MSNQTISRRHLLSVGGGAALTGILPSRSMASTKQVPRRVLGKTGQKIPILLFGGAVRLDRRFDPKLAEAFRFGVNYIDAASSYGGGTCEIAVGNFWTRAKLRRQDFWITSKSELHDPQGFTKTLLGGLAKMQTSYCDLYYLHALEDEKYLNSELEKTVAKLKKQGKIKYFGFSAHDGNVPQLLQAAAKRPWIDSVMFRYNFRTYDSKELNKAIDAAHKANIGLIAMKTQGSEASFRDAWKKFEKTGKWNKYQAVLKAVWADERITAAVSHMQTLTQLRENIEAALDDKKLTQAEQQALDKYAEATRSLACDGCDHLCNPAVNAPVKIGATIRYLMYAEIYGEEEKAYSLFKNLPPEAQKLANIDFAAAQNACPHGVNIVELMNRAQRRFNGQVNSDSPIS